MTARRRPGLGGRAAGVGFAIGCLLTASAHVGTSNAYFEGSAGPYPVRVIVRMPGVIPGLAQISVRVTGDELPSRVTVRPLRWDAGLEGAPPPDTARAVPGETGLYSAELWLMTTGSYSVRVSMEGDAGDGVALVPVNATAERRLEMRSGMALGLIAAGLFLFFGAITVFGAAVRESVVEPGVEPTAKRRRVAAWTMAIGGIVLALLLWGGWSWWGAVDRAYRAGMFRPLATSASVTDDGSGRALTLQIDDPAWRGREWTPLIADHGKLMHMFLVSDRALEAFAHVHPESVDSTSFVTPLPPLPAGDYRLYADIVHESGFSQTLVDTVTVIDGTGTPAFASVEVGARSDDSWAVLPEYGSASSDIHVLPSGRRVEWTSGLDPRADEEVSLQFRVYEPSGEPSTLEPYLGMLSHAAVTTADGSVFVHLHPVGSISLAAKQRFETGDAGAVADPAAAMGASNGTGGGVSFPFVFPTAGSYRIFVQVRVAGAVETAAFDVDVPERSGSE